MAALLCYDISITTNKYQVNSNITTKYLKEMFI